MPRLDADMIDTIRRTALCYAATINDDGTPNLSPKATLSALDGDRLAFIDIASPGTVANLRKRPAIEINVVDIFLRRGYRFAGRGSVLADGPIFAERVAYWRGRLGPAYPMRHVVVVDVTRAIPVKSPLYAFEPMDDAAILARYRKVYGY